VNERTPAVDRERTETAPQSLRRSGRNLIKIKGPAEEMVRIVAAGGAVVLENDQSFETHGEVVDKIVKATRGRAKKPVRVRSPARR
jgi:hypothetical protein